jgi:hypothetical protein
MPSVQLEQLTSEVMELVPQPELDVIERRTARRRVRRRAAAAALSVVVASSAAAVSLSTYDKGGPELSASAVPAACRVTGQLARPAGYEQVGVAGADRTGRYLIGTGFSPKDRTVHLVWWHDGVPRTAGVAASFLMPIDVNTAGAIAGYTRSIGSTDEGDAWVYRDGRLHNLPTPAGLHSASAAGINERGDVAGVARDASGAGVAVVWPAATPERPRVLAAPGPVHVDGIGDDGTVIGRLTDGRLLLADAGRGYVWSPDGRGRELAVPDGWTRAQAVSIEAGWILGYVDREGAVALARWRLDGGTVRVLSRMRGDFVGTTANGWSVVWGRTPLLADVDGRVKQVTGHDKATGDRMILGGGAVWVGGDSGGLAVVGNALSAAGAIRPVRWRCGA